MTRTKKIVTTAALVLGATAAAASPALAENHATVTPQHSHATVVTPADFHATVVTPADFHATVVTPADFHATVVSV
ncbi:hypothetical protein [Streptomyces sp. NPDC001076]